MARLRPRSVAPGQLVGVNSTVKARGGGVRVASLSDWLGLSANPGAPQPAGCHSAGVCGWDRACGVGRLVAVGGHWDIVALPSARLRACLRARLRALMRLLRAISGSRSADFRERVRITVCALGIGGWSVSAQRRGERRAAMQRLTRGCLLGWRPQAAV